MGVSGDVEGKPRTEHYIYIGELDRVEREVCPILSGVGDAGRFGARTRYDRVLERALSWSVVKRAVLRTFPQDIDRTSRT